MNADIKHLIADEAFSKISKYFDINPSASPQTGSYIGTFTMFDVIYNIEKNHMGNYVIKEGKKEQFAIRLNRNEAMELVGYSIVPSAQAGGYRKKRRSTRRRNNRRRATKRRSTRRHK